MTTSHDTVTLTAEHIGFSVRCSIPGPLYGRYLGDVRLRRCADGRRVWIASAASGPIHVVDTKADAVAALIADELPLAFGGGR